MHLDFEGSEVQVDLRGESTVRSPETGDTRERVRVGVPARDHVEHRQFLEIIQRARRHGINSTDGHGHVINKWRVLDATSTRLKGADPEYNLVFELEEFK